MWATRRVLIERVSVTLTFCVPIGPASDAQLHISWAAFSGLLGCAEVLQV